MADENARRRDGTTVTHSRLYTSADGETHFDDVTVKMTPVVLGPDVPPGDMAAPAPVTDLTFLRLDPRYTRDWHPAPRRQYVLISAGAIEVTVSDGEVRRFGPGSAFLAEDTTGKGHQTRVVGAEDCLVIWVSGA